jgi:hypothetical protein
MTEETANALHVGIGVAATCIGVACSVYHCCCRVWRRLKCYTPTAAAGAVAAAGLMAAGQLSSVTTAGPPPNRGDAGSGASGSCRATSAGECQSAAQPQCSSASQDAGDCQASAQPQCSSTSGPQDSGDCQPPAQPRCSPASGAQTVRTSLVLTREKVLNCGNRAGERACFQCRRSRSAQEWSRWQCCTCWLGWS